MNGAAVDEIFRRGLANLIDEGWCQHHRVSPLLAGQVLIYLALHADAGLCIAYGSDAVADDLGVGRRNVRNAYAALADMGRIERTGGRLGRAIEYRLDVEGDVVPRRKRRLATPPVGAVDNVRHLAGEVAGDVAGEVAGEVAERPAAKGREVKSSSSRHYIQPPVVAALPSFDDDDETTLSEPEIAAVVFDGLPVPMPPNVRKMAVPWIRAGWLASDLNRHLLDNINPSKCESVVAVVRSLLANVEPPTAAHRRNERDLERERQERLLDDLRAVSS